MKELYVGRRPGIVPKVLNLDRYAVLLLEELAPTPRSQGAFLGALILAEYARREERRRLRALVAEDPPTAVGAASQQATQEVLCAAK